MYGKYQMEDSATAIVMLVWAHDYHASSPRRSPCIWVLQNK